MAGRTFASSVWTDIGGPLVFASSVWMGFGGPLVFSSSGWNSSITGARSVTATITGAGTVSTGLELRMDFTSKSNGAMPATADTGQTLVKTWNTTSNANPVISGGRYIINATDASAQAGYLTADLTGEITWLEADFQWSSSGSTNGMNCTLVSWRDAMPTGWLGGISAQGAPVHVSFTNVNWIASYFPPTTGPVTTITTHTYSSAFNTTANQHVTVEIDKANSRMFVTGPDGVRVTVNDSHIGSIAGNYACCEIFYNTASTDKRTLISSFKADS